MNDTPALRPVSVVRTLASAAAVLAVGACSPSAPQEEQRPAASEPTPSASASASESSSRVTGLDPEGTTRAQITEGLTVSVEDFERTQDAQGEPALTFDLTLTNATGQTFDATRVAVFAFHGPDTQEAPPTILEFDENGSGRSAHFDEPLPDGEEATLTYGFNVDPDHEQVLIAVEPEGDDAVFFSGAVPL
ncbi:hypothetical protein MRI28_00105 [Nocardiopsis dassonvillei]|uniref:hypothetical protein n=1 Tax=Nocardiopsis dassonvillei TaxID=2014 RepID=UPI00200DDED3|nr:hypothetical protein [Nocardiopsis dassonvillei]MCK9868072.1 hypothetical protein [Nocardiopsis dassonvillei]